MKTKQKKWFAVAYNKKPNCMVGQPFEKRESCEKVLPFYKKKGWTGGIVRVNAPKPMNEEDKKALEPLSKALKQMSGLMNQHLK